MSSTPSADRFVAVISEWLRSVGLPRRVLISETFAQQLRNELSLDVRPLCAQCRSEIPPLRPEPNFVGTICGVNVFTDKAMHGDQMAVVLVGDAK